MYEPQMPGEYCHSDKGLRDCQKQNLAFGNFSFVEECTLSVSPKVILIQDTTLIVLDSRGSNCLCFFFPGTLLQ